MFLLILDKDPIKAAQLIPDKLKFKQLLELCQLICGAGYSNVYKKINQGKEIKTWIVRNPIWVKKYALTLYELCKNIVNMSIKTQKDFIDIISSIPYEMYKDKQPCNGIFRYSKNYISNYVSNVELPIDECIKQYKEYVAWKVENKVKGYV